jgi:arylsulfatase
MPFLITQQSFEKTDACNQSPARRPISNNTYDDWFLDRAYLLVPAQAYVEQFLKTFKEYPPRQKAESFSLDKVLEKLQTSTGSR